MIPMTDCNSSMLAAHGYDPVSRVLAVRFKGADKVHHHKDVPQEVADGMASAESVGKFYNASIRGKFEHTVVLDEPPTDKSLD